MVSPARAFLFSAARWTFGFSWVGGGSRVWEDADTATNAVNPMKQKSLFNAPISNRLSSCCGKALKNLSVDSHVCNETATRCSHSINNAFSFPSPLPMRPVAGWFVPQVVGPVRVLCDLCVLRVEKLGIILRYNPVFPSFRGTRWMSPGRPWENELQAHERLRPSRRSARGH